MAVRQLAIAAALLGVAIPGHAFDTRDEAQSVMFYFAIPLDAWFAGRDGDEFGAYYVDVERLEA